MNKNNQWITPNFFIVGAAKSATTSLANYLDQHPEIFMSPVKEPFYFVSDIGLNNYAEYLSLFRKAGNASAVGEASPGYLFDEHAVLAIYEKFPDAKIIIILRNPVEMAFSFWQFMLALGNESKNFEEAISDAEREFRKSEQFKKTCKGWWANYLYLERALYFKQVKRYFDVFGRSNVRVYIFERFIEEPVKYCQDIFGYLGVNVNFVPVCKKINEGGKMRFKFICDLTSRPFPLLRKLLPFRYRTNIRVIIDRLNRKRGPELIMNSGIKSFLEDFFHNDIKQLENLLQYNIPEWKFIHKRS